MTRLRDSRILAALASLKLAAALIALLALLSLLAVIIPQQGYLGPAYEQFVKDVPWLEAVFSALGLHRIYSGWPIVLLSALLVVNLVACTLWRILRRQHAVRAVPDVPSPLSDAAHMLASERWKFLGGPEGRVVARAGGSGFWGSVIMHAGLVVIVAGAVATVLTSFRGEMVISEGQTLTDQKGDYFSVSAEPSLGTSYSDTRLALDAMKVDYEGGVVVGASASMRAIEPDGDVITHEVRVNHPLDAGGKSYLLQDSGYSARMVVAYEGGAADPLIVALGQEMPYGWIDHLELESPQGAPVAIDLLATPVPLEEWQDLPLEKFTIADPRLRMRIQAGDSAWEGVLAPGESASTGDLTVTFEGLGLWNRYLVRGEPARWITYAGFYIAIIGAAWRFLVPERRIAVTVRDGVLSARLHARPWKGRFASRDEALVRSIITCTNTSGMEMHEGASDDDC